MMKLLLSISILALWSVATIHQMGQIHMGAPEKSNLPSPDSVRYLPLPERSKDAMGAKAFVREVTDLSISEREKAIVREILSGNVPSFARRLKPIKINETIDGQVYELLIFSTQDYMAIGSDEDYIYIPMTPATAQFLADTLDCILPTKKIVDLIYAEAKIKLRPQPIPPSEKMITIPVFRQHTDSIKQQMMNMGATPRANEMVAGHKKDIIISNKIYDQSRTSEPVVIYGWHKSRNNPIQPVYNGHIASYADYSHGVRFISNEAFLNGTLVEIKVILRDPTYSTLLSDEGVIRPPYYSIK